jgi:RNA polymerase sigma-70 factor, ECF subfamily
MTQSSSRIAQRAWHRLNRRTDEELVVAIVAGDHDAITVLFERYARLVFRVAERILRDPGEAEEILQTVFLDIFRCAGKFDPERGSVRIWLLQYAYHRSMRRRQHLRARHFYTAEQIDAVVSEIARHVPPQTWNLLPQEASRLVSQSLTLINDRQRKTIEMTYFEGLTADEVAERTGESTANVRHNLYRGLAKLREHLGSHRPKGPRSVDRRAPFRQGGIVDARA